MPKKIRSRLVLARKRMRFDQKQIAELLRHSSVQLCRFEVGEQIPRLKVAIKLAILYRLPIRTLFHALYEVCQEELDADLKKIGPVSAPHRDITLPADYCSYIELMNSSLLNGSDEEKIRRHIKQLMNDRAHRIL
jgi:transcriptional regulator with XRE-family HTH domain